MGKGMMYKRIYAEKDFYIDERKPSLKDPIPSDLRTHSLHEKIRWWIQFPFGYKVYTLREIGVGEGTEIAYCFVSKAGNYRYPFAKEDDIIVGPYYVAPEYRGNHQTTSEHF